jgi:hypothetical protein
VNEHPMVVGERVRSLRVTVVISCGLCYRAARFRGLAVRSPMARGVVRLAALVCFLALLGSGCANTRHSNRTEPSKEKLETGEQKAEKTWFWDDTRVGQRNGISIEPRTEYPGYSIR